MEKKRAAKWQANDEKKNSFEEIHEKKAPYTDSEVCTLSTLQQ